MKKRQFKRSNSEVQKPPSSQGKSQYNGMNYGTESGLPEGVDSAMGQEVSPEKKRQVDMVNSTLTDMLYNAETKASVQAMLQKGKPEQSIPFAVNSVFQKFESMTKQKNGDMPLDIKLAGGVHLFSEVMELAEALGVIPEDMPEEAMQPLLKETMQQYITKGLKDKSIDPIDLQRRVEPLLSQEEREIGLQLGAGQGTPGEMSQGQGMEGALRKQMQPMQVENQQLKDRNKQMTGALQGMASGGQEQ